MLHLNQTFLRALEKIQERKLAAMQAQPVLIKDLIILDKQNPRFKDCYWRGEFDGVEKVELLKESNAQYVKRVLGYMEALGNQVQEIHNQNHQGNPNFITRMLMPEAFLFPASVRRHETETTKERTGIHFENLVTLVEQLQIIVTNYSSNVHLLFSSIPVVLPDKMIHNIAIYIQCGEQPIIHVIAKAYGDRHDAFYVGTKIFTLEDELALVLPSLRTAEQVKENIGVDLEYGGIISCQTTGGVSFYTGIDICADHIMEVGKNRIQALVNSCRRKGTSDFLANKGSYVISSNTVDRQPQSEIATMITHADPRQRGPSAVLYSGNQVFKDEDIKITDVTANTFGIERVFYEYPARKIGEFEQTLANEILQHNRLMVKLNALRQYRAQRVSETDLVHVQCVKTIIEFMLEEVKTMLEDETLNQSKKSPLMVFDFTLKKIMQNYPQNIDAVEAILESMQELMAKKYFEKDRAKTQLLVDICLGLIHQDALDNQAAKDELPRSDFNFI